MLNRFLPSLAHLPNPFSQPKSAYAMDVKLQTPPHWTVVKSHRWSCLPDAYANHIVYHDDKNIINVEFWSRGHRKRRYPTVNLPGHRHDFVKGFREDWANISFQVALWFTLGSCLWIVNGQYALFSTASDAGAVMGWTALAGGLLFEVGAVFAYWESLNEPYDRDFGTWIEDVLKDTCRIPVSRRIPWKWYGTDWKNMGFVANFIQLIGATLFTLAVIAGIPGLIAPEQWQLQQALWWTPQTIGSVCFAVSSGIAMLEEQTHWNVPSFLKIGWWSAFWNMIGSIGFLLCAVFGYLANWQGQEVCCQVYGTALSTYWGSWAFLIASVLQLIEVLLKHPTL